MTVEDVSAAAALQRKLDKKLEERRRVETRFLDFCRVNRVEPWSADSVVLFLGSVRAQLGAGSVKKHALVLKQLERLRFLPSAAQRLRLLVGITTEEYAAKGVSHCDDFKDLQAAILTVLALEGKARDAAACMLVLGHRCETLLKPFRSDQIAVDLTVPRIAWDLKFTKNRRSTDAKFRIILKDEMLRWFPPLLLRVVERCFRRSHSPFEHYTYDELNEAVKVACVDPAMNCTPGSLRRAFVWTAIVVHTHDDVTDWEKVRALTGHMKASTLQAYYQRDLFKSFDDWCTLRYNH
jgi:hypothetical protein